MRINTHGRLAFEWAGARVPPPENDLLIAPPMPRFTGCAQAPDNKDIKIIGPDKA
jgi:hypothetical protein